ncbi:MAG: NAD-dependent epimerase/dehydratase family protein [Candidatus Bathyarchaeia archaeon]
MHWKDKHVLVTGGASFIGSHLVDKLVELGAKVTVVDNFSSGTLENLSQSIQKIRVVKMDLEWCRLDEIVKVFRGHDVVFHLAATHGGRGYIHTHPADVCSNFAIDHHVFEACLKADVERVVMASSACVYPPKLQATTDSDYLLKEDDTNPFRLDEPLSADIEYGWAKLMGEVQLIAFIKQYGIKGCILRFVTAYGPRENETHAIIALIYKAFERMDPYVIWGSGEQERDFTYVSDIVDGTILAAEKVTDGTPINLGTGKRYKIKDVASKIFDIMGWRPKRIIFDASKPEGVASRALDISRAKNLLGWSPKVSLEEGLRKTIQYYISTHKPRGYVDEKILMERFVEDE